MALVDFKLLPGIDKQQTQVGAERRWVSSDNVRFRYGLPEKVGGWSSLLTDTIVGVARAQHSFVDLDGNRYVAIGTDKFLLIYYEGQLYDITPLGTTISSATFTFNGTTTITITTSAAHNLLAGAIVLFDGVTLPGGTGLSDSDFEDKLFQVITTPTAVTFYCYIYQYRIFSNRRKCRLKTLHTRGPCGTNLWLWFWCWKFWWNRFRCRY